MGAQHFLTQGLNELAFGFLKKEMVFCAFGFRNPEVG